jgi:hypothetical protein
MTRRKGHQTDGFGQFSIGRLSCRPRHTAQGGNRGDPGNLRRQSPHPAVCDRPADEGYVAIAPSIFDRVERNFQCGYSPEEVTVARKFVANPDEIPGSMRSLSSGRA